MPPTSLLHLPNEIIKCILDQLGSAKDYHTLIQLSSTNSRLRLVAESNMFRYIKVKENERFADTALAIQRTPGARAYIQTLCLEAVKKPKRSAQTKNSKSKLFDPRDKNDDFTNQNNDGFVCPEEIPSLYDPSDLHRHTTKVSDQGLAPSLMSLKQLKRLRIGHAFRYPQLGVNWLLTKLNALHISVCQSRMVLHCPQLKSLELENCRCDKNAYPPRTECWRKLGAVVEKTPTLKNVGLVIISHKNQWDAVKPFLRNVPSLGLHYVSNICRHLPDLATTLCSEAPNLQKLYLPSLISLVMALTSFPTHPTYRFYNDWDLLTRCRWELPPLHVAELIALTLFGASELLNEIEFCMDCHHAHNMFCAGTVRSVTATRDLKGMLMGLEWKGGLAGSYCGCGKAWCCGNTETDQTLARLKWECTLEGMIWRMYLGVRDWEDFGVGESALMAKLSVEELAELWRDSS